MTNPWPKPSKRASPIAPRPIRPLSGRPTRSRTAARALAGFVFVLLLTDAVAGVRVTDLRCESATNPIGLDEAQPRFSWRIESNQRATRQTACQVLVATEPNTLAREQGDLWDSGRVATDQSIQFVYSGKAPGSRQICWWKVRVWDQTGRASDWSTPARWEMGLLAPGDWQAGWIGLPIDWPGRTNWAAARWIWAPRPDDPAAESPPQATLRRRLLLPNLPIRRARFRLTADSYYQLNLNGEEVARNTGLPYARSILQEIDVTESLFPGRNLLAVIATNSSGQAGVLGQLVVEYDNAAPLSVVTDGSWFAKAGAQATWVKPGLADADWRPAAVVAALGSAPWESVKYGPMRPAVHFRSGVSLGRPIRRARLYATALGVYEVHLNGQRVGQDRFNPGWTDYSKRVQYHTYDVTSLLRAGPNTLGIVLGDGWYSGFVGLGGRERYGALPLARAQLEVEFIDGTRQVLATGSDWKAAVGPILQSDLLMGETYDARREMPGWADAKFDDSDWEPVVTRQVGVALVAARDEPVRSNQELKPVAANQPRSNHLVFDLGQNIVGHVRLKVRGKAGEQVRIRYGEMLMPNGMIYTNNLREARCVDTYTLRGGREEVYEPHFTVHGFRFVELYDYPGQPPKDAVTGIVVHSDLSPAGTFECSNTNLNRLFQNLDWTQRGNAFSVPTDCPQRDERLGRSGNAQIALPTAIATRNVARFYTKWLQDIADAQGPDGAFTDVAPDVTVGGDLSAWDDAGVVVPWLLYRAYGDRRLLERHYVAGARWVDYLERHSRGLLRPAEGWGDWLAVEAETPKDLVATAGFARSAQLMARSAAVLGRTTDAARYENLFARIKTAFLKAYVAADGRIAGNTQTAYLLALELDLLPDDLRSAALSHLIENLKARGYHLSTGYIGTPLLLPTLTRAGQTKLAYRLLTQPSYPSWIYPVRRGATTVWERWDSWTRDGGFQTPDLNSFNHPPLGAIGDWILGTVGGLAPGPEQPAFQHVLIHPQPGGDLTWARAEYDSAFGRIATHWRVREERFELDLTLPPNTTATLVLPARSSDEVREGGRPAYRSEGLTFLRQQGDSQVFSAGSGQYRFVIRPR